jgi:aminobutyraldehyde dehydrogenase
MKFRRSSTFSASLPAPPALPGLAAGEYLEGHLDDPPRSGGRGGLYRAVELSADDGGLEAGPGAGGGNCVVIKPSEITPLTALKLAELAKIFPRAL